MAEIGRAAGLSRQAVYLHFADRADLLMALVAHVDERRGLDAEVHKIVGAADGMTALRELVSLQARMNPGVWPIARAFDGVRRIDAAAERAWQNRMRRRLEGNRKVIGRLSAEGRLRPGIDPGVAADLSWTLTSLRVWEDLVRERGWSAARYERTVFAILAAALTTGGPARAAAPANPKARKVRGIRRRRR